MKKALRKFLFLFLTSRAQFEMSYLGHMRYFNFFFFQRILRVNSNVPWPVHHSSHVTQPERVVQKEALPFLGMSPACYIQAINGIHVGHNVLHGPNVHIISANHDLNDFSVHPKIGPIVLGDNCWIGAGSIILGGVELAEHVVVAAGSVVTKSFGPNVLIGGIPAKVLKDLPEYGCRLTEPSSVS